MDQDDHDDKQRRLREENKMLLNKYDQVFVFRFFTRPDLTFFIPKFQKISRKKNYLKLISYLMRAYFSTVTSLLIILYLIFLTKRILKLKTLHNEISFHFKTFRTFLYLLKDAL